MRFTRKCVSNSYFRPYILLLYRNLVPCVRRKVFFSASYPRQVVWCLFVCPLLQLIKDSFEKKLILRLLPPFQKKDGGKTPQHLKCYVRLHPKIVAHAAVATTPWYKIAAAPIILPWFWCCSQKYMRWNMFLQVSSRSINPFFEKIDRIRNINYKMGKSRL